MITGAIQGTSRDKIYQELGLETLKSRRWYERLSCMFKIMNEEAPNYLINLIPKCHQFIRTRNSQIPTFHCQMDCFKYSFFLSTLNDWFNLDSIRNSESISIFKSRLLSFICLFQSKYYNIFDPRLKFLICLRLGFSHLNEHRFCHNFQDCIIFYVLVVWRLKIFYITFCTATTFHSFARISWIVQNLYLIILSLFLTKLKKMFF